MGSVRGWNLVFGEATSVGRPFASGLIYSFNQTKRFLLYTKNRLRRTVALRHLETLPARLGVARLVALWLR